MTAEELQQQLTLNGLLCRVQREEVQIETCLYCGNTRWNLELNASRGLYHCWACNVGGRLDALLRQELGQDIYIPTHLHKPTPPPTLTPPTTFASSPAYNVGPAAKYLERRLVDQDTAKRYGLVVCTEAEHRLVGRLVIPIHNFWTGEVAGYVGRSFTGRYPKYLSTMDSRMIGGYRATTWQPPCVLVEGFFDGIAIHRAGYHSAVLAGIAGGPLLQQFVARLPLDTPLIIMLDASATQQASTLRASLLPLRSDKQLALAQLPKGKDPADFTPTILKYVVERVAGRFC